MKNGGSMPVPIINMVTRVVTMIGGVDVIGDIQEAAKDTGWERLWRPCQLMPNQQGLSLRPMLVPHNVICGDYMVINMRSVIWINEPADHLLRAYLAARSGIAIPSSAEMAGVNQ